MVRILFLIQPRLHVILPLATIQDGAWYALAKLKTTVWK